VTTLTNNFEGGSSGTTITTGNSGGTSGNAFDVVQIGASATDAYDNTRAAHGSLSCKIATPAGATTSYNSWTTSMGSQSQVWFRLYLYFTANPPANHRVLQLLSGGSAAAGVIVASNGKLLVVNAAGSSVTTSTATIPLNAWFRIEGFVIGSATVGQTELKLFTSADSTTPAETDSSAATQNTTGTLDTYRFGVAVSVASVGPFWMDDIGLSAAGYIGPSLFTVTLAAVSASHPAIARGTAKRAAGSVHPSGAVAKIAAKDLAGTAHPAGKLSRGTARHLAAAARTAASLSRGFARILAARVAAAARLRQAGPSLSFTACLPGFQWETGTAETRWPAGEAYFQWATGDPDLS
jgi:hypothetical protein